MDPASVPALKPPPGVVSNFVNPISQGQRNIILHSTSLTLVTLFIIMRIYTRYFIAGSMNREDYICLVAYAMTIVSSALFLSAQRYGFGRHQWDIQQIHLVEMSKLLFVVEILYLPMVAIIKLVFLLFFRRVFAPSRKMKYFTDFGIFAVVSFYLIVFFRTLFACDPLQKAYNKSLPGHCYKGYADGVTMAFVTGIFNIITDFYTIFLPLPLIWHLNMKTSRKLRLIAIFSVGLIACAATTFRLAFSIITLNRPDITWNYSTLSLWSVLEVDVGIICACSLALPAFLDLYSSYIIRFISAPFSSSSRVFKSNTSAGDGGHHPTFAIDRLRQHGHASKTDRYSEFDTGKPDTAPIMMGDGPDHFVTRTTVTSGGPAPSNDSVEDWTTYGVVRTVDLEQSFSMAVRNVEPV